MAPAKHTDETDRIVDRAATKAIAQLYSVVQDATGPINQKLEKVSESVSMLRIDLAGLRAAIPERKHNCEQERRERVRLEGEIKSAHERIDSEVEKRVDADTTGMRTSFEGSKTTTMQVVQIIMMLLTLGGIFALFVGCSAKPTSRDITGTAQVEYTLSKLLAGKTPSEQVAILRGKLAEAEAKKQQAIEDRVASYTFWAYLVSSLGFIGCIAAMVWLPAGRKLLATAAATCIATMAAAYFIGQIWAYLPWVLIGLCFIILISVMRSGKLAHMMDPPSDDS